MIHDVLSMLISILPVDLGALGLSIATVLAAGLIFLLRALFNIAQSLAKKTPSAVDDKIVEETRSIFRDRSKEL